MSSIRRLPSYSTRAAALGVSALTGFAVLVAAPPALAAAPNIVSVSPAATVGMGAGQSGHPARQIVISVDNVATTDTVTVTFPNFTGLTATVQTPLGTSGGHTTVTANVSTSGTSAPSSNFNLTLTDVTTNSSDTTPFSIVAAPTLSSASPSRLVRGTTTSVTLTGTGMQSGVVASASGQSGVTFGAVTVGGGGTSGTVSVTVANNAATGPLAVTLSNPDAGWSTQTGAITIDAFVVSDISPTSATNATSSTAVPLTVTGQGIPSGNTVLRLTPTFAVTGQDPIVVNPTSISANGQQWQGNANLVGVAPGAYQAQLVNGSDSGTLTSKTFTVVTAGAPTITTVSPSTLGQGADALLTLTGTNFARGATVSFSKSGFTTTGPVVFISTTQLQVPIHVASNAATGSNNATNVTVTNTGAAPNSGTKTAALQVTPPPTISSVTPSPIGQGAATTLTIAGTNFQSQSTVSFGTGITATGGQTLSGTTQIKIPVKVAANSPNKVNVTVKNPDGGTATLQLTVNPVTLTGVSPRYVSNTFSGNLVLSGSGFRTGATVSFPAGSGVAVQGGKSATVANNGASITVPITVSRSTAAPVDVTVTNTGTDLGTVTCTGCLGVALAPSRPSGVVATKNGTTATVQWAAVTPPSDGGAPITGFTVSVTSPANSGIPAQSLGANVTSATFGNLAVNTDYAFAITATNAANLTSGPATATTSRKSRLSIHAGAARVVTGQSVRLFGVLLSAQGAAIPGASVAVAARSDAGTPSNLGSVLTDSTGRWSMIVRPRVNETYSAAYAGDGSNEGSNSGTARVIAKARVTIHGTRHPDRNALTVYGRVTPSKSGETVRLVAIDSNGRLHHLGRTFLNGRSRYRFEVAQPRAGWRLQVRIGSTGGNGAGRSSFLLA
jgi:hypothetical protein